MPERKPTKRPRATKEKRFTMAKGDVLVNRGDVAAVLVRYERTGDLRFIRGRKR